MEKIYFFCVIALFLTSCGVTKESGVKVQSLSKSPIIGDRNLDPEPIICAPPADLSMPLKDLDGKQVFSDESVSRQGLRGVVKSQGGNLMPFTCDTKEDCARISKEQGMRISYKPSARIYVFKTHISWPESELFSHASISLEELLKNPNFIGITESNQVGGYAVGLPPGLYTVASEYTSHGSKGEFTFAKVEIKEGVPQLLDIVAEDNTVW